MQAVASERTPLAFGCSPAPSATNSLDDLQVPIALDPSRHEQILSVEAELVDTDKIRDIAPPVVKKIDPYGIAHFSLALKGRGRGLLLGCPTGRASLLVHFKIRSEVPVPE